MRHNIPAELLCSIFLCLFLVSGCSSGRSDSPGTGISAVTPAGGATGVSENTAVSATFAVDVDPSTVNASTFVVKDALGTAVDGKITCDGKSATFTPAADLSLSTKYTTTITSGVMNLMGEATPGYSWTFTVKNGAWQTPVALGQTDIPGALASDDSGNVLAAWVQSSTGGQNINGQNIYAARYAAGSGWESPVVVSTLSSPGVAYSAAVAMIGNGNAMLFWRQDNGGSPTQSLFYYAEYSPGSGWGTPAPVISAPIVVAGTPRLTSDSRGNAFAVWSQFDGTDTHIYAARYSAGHGWDSPVSIDPAAGFAENAGIAIDDSGNAIVTWYKHTGLDENIYVCRYSNQRGWGPAALIGTGGRNPAISMDGQGNAVVAWAQFDGTSVSIFAKRYLSASGWEETEVIGPGVTWPDDPNWPIPTVVVDRTGNAAAFWSQSSLGLVWARFTAGSGWDAPALLIQAEIYEPPVAAADGAGNIRIIWSPTLQYGIYSMRYIAGSGWTDPVGISSDVLYINHPYTVMALDAAGRATVAWIQGDNQGRSIYANRFQ